MSEPRAVTNHTRQPLRLKAELEHAVSSSSSSGGGSSSVHSFPFDLPYSCFTVDALSTVMLPVVFVPLEAGTAAARLHLRKSCALADDDGDDAADVSDVECAVVSLTGKGCRGLLSISRGCGPALALAPGGGGGGGQVISVRNRVGLPLPFVVTQSGMGSVLPSNGFIPAYGSVTLVAGGDARASGCSASICIVRELLERSFRSTLRV